MIIYQQETITQMVRLLLNLPKTISDAYNGKYPQQIFVDLIGRESFLFVPFDDFLLGEEVKENFKNFQRDGTELAYLNGLESLFSIVHETFGMWYDEDRLIYCLKTLLKARIRDCYATKLVKDEYGFLTVRENIPPIIMNRDGSSVDSVSYSEWVVRTVERRLRSIQWACNNAISVCGRYSFVYKKNELDFHFISGGGVGDSWTLPEGEVKAISQQPQTTEPGVKLQWKGDKTDLAELVWALSKTSRIVDQTTGQPIKQNKLADLIGKTFGLSLDVTGLMKGRMNTYKATSDGETFTKNLFDLVNDRAASA